MVRPACWGFLLLGCLPPLLLLPSRSYACCTVQFVRTVGLLLWLSVLLITDRCVPLTCLYATVVLQ